MHRLEALGHLDRARRLPVACRLLDRARRLPASLGLLNLAALAALGGSPLWTGAQQERQRQAGMREHASKLAQGPSRLSARRHRGRC